MVEIALTIDHFEILVVLLSSTLFLTRERSIVETTLLLNVYEPHRCRPRESGDTASGLKKNDFSEAKPLLHSGS